MTLAMQTAVLDVASASEAGRGSAGVWLELEQGFRRAAQAMREIGEERQAQAFDADASSIECRAVLHLKAIARRGTNTEAEPC